jgi:hypothetical protein
MSQVQYLSQIGGLSMEDNTRRVMTTIITNGFAQSFSYHGKGKKACFKNLLMNNVVIG